jgi:hypothetical protein
MTLTSIARAVHAQASSVSRWRDGESTPSFIHGARLLSMVYEKAPAALPREGLDLVLLLAPVIVCTFDAANVIVVRPERTRHGLGRPPVGNSTRGAIENLLRTLRADTALAREYRRISRLHCGAGRGEARIVRGRKPPDNYRAKLRALQGHPTPTHPLPQSVYGPGAPPPHLDSAPSLPPQKFRR